MLLLDGAAIHWEHGRISSVLKVDDGAVLYIVFFIMQLPGISSGAETSATRTQNNAKPTFGWLWRG